MKKVFINIQDCVPGMQMAETIFNDYGAVVISENTIMDFHLINKLKNLNIEKIKIYDHAEHVIIANDSELFKSQYKDNVEVVKGMLHEISTGKNVDMKKVDAVSDSILVRINENRDIVSCFNQIRGADEYTYTHSINVSLLSMLIGKWMKYDEKSIRMLVQAGVLHDIGKSMIPPDILSKPGPLTEEEYEEIKKHPVYGYRIVDKMDGIDPSIKKAILMHHEREDGSGYPMALKDYQIHKFAKILSVADIYDAMTSNRAYREKESPFDVFELLENKTFGVLNPVVVNAFLSNIAAYYIGDLVKLNTGDIGEIVYINPRHISQPVVRVREEFIDLTVKTNIKISELL